MGWIKGLEPSTSGTTIQRSNQLSYTHRVATAVAAFRFAAGLCPPAKTALRYYGAPLSKPTRFAGLGFEVGRKAENVAELDYNILWYVFAIPFCYLFANFGKRTCHTLCDTSS